MCGWSGLVPWYPLYSTQLPPGVELFLNTEAGLTPEQSQAWPPNNKQQCCLLIMPNFPYPRKLFRINWEIPWNDTVLSPKSIFKYGKTKKSDAGRLEEVIRKFPMKQHIDCYGEWGLVFLNRGRHHTTETALKKCKCLI